MSTVMRGAAGVRWALSLVACLAIVLTLARVAAAQESGSELDRSTPRRAVASFIETAETRDFERAAEVLDLHLLPAAERTTRGPELARALERVIERNIWLELATISDDPKGRLEDGEGIEQFATARLAGRDVPLTLARLPDGTWKISASTVARIPKLYDEHGPGPVEERVPELLRGRVLGLAYWQWLGLLVAIVAGVLLGRLLAWSASRLAGRIAKHTAVRWDEELLEALRSPARFGLGILSFRVLLEPLALSAAAGHIASRVVGTIAIIVTAWLAIRVTAVLSHLLERLAEDVAVTYPQFRSLREVATKQ